MDDFETNTILSKLPPRVHVASAARTHDYSSTVVESYVQNAVMRVDPLDPDDEIMTSVMDALFAARVLMPVSVSDLKRLRLPQAVRKQPRIFARLLVTLNGSDEPLVTPVQLRIAAERETALRGTSTGWGSSDAHDFTDYTSNLLLKSVGVAEELLPPAKSVPALTKSQIDAAFEQAAAYFQWKR